MVLSRARRIGISLTPFLAPFLLARCWQNALAPQDAEIIFRVTGLPNDPGISVTAFVEDLAPPHNRVTKTVPIGGSVLFDNLGAGFDIQVGTTNLTPFGCRLRSISGTTAMFVGSSFVDAVKTGPSSVDTVTADLSCRSGFVDLQLSGLPAGETALVDFVSPSEPQPAALNTVLVANGTTRVPVFPDQRISIEPLRVIAGGRVYQASAVLAAVMSRQVASAIVTYAPLAPPPGPPATILVRLAGVPADPNVRVTTFVRSASGNLGTYTVGIGASATFASLASGVAVEVGVDNLATSSCIVTGASLPTTPSGTATVANMTTRSGVTDTVTFQLKCRAATLNLTVAGLPANDQGTIDLFSPVDTLSRRMPNGSSLLSIVPHDSVHIVPAQVSGSDGRTYTAAPQLVALRTTASVTVQYAAPASCAANRPTAWYPMNGNANDSSGNGLHGTIVGPVPAPNRNNTQNSALFFDGVDDRIDLGDRFNTLTLPFSIAMWVSIPTFVSEFRSLFATDDEAGRYAGFFFQLTPTGQLQITYADGGLPGSGSRRTFETSAPLPAYGWVHVAATVRGPTDMTLYVNGASVPGAYSGTGGSMLHTNFPARIGSFSLISANRAWYGSIDDVRLYDCSLSASDVPAIMNVP